MRSNDIQFDIKRSRRRTVAIHVSNNQVEVRAPHGTSKSFIDEFVSEKREWILDKLIEQEKKHSEVLKIGSGEKIPFMGFEIGIEIESAKRNSAKLVKNILTLKLSERTADSSIKTIDRWLIRQAKKHIPDLVELFAKEMNLWGRVTDIKFRKTKSKWGHCTAQGVLQFNPLILLAPEFVMNYLIVHELCHLVHQNHSKSYWSLVQFYDPSYKKAEVWLKEYGHTLWYQ